MRTWSPGRRFTIRSPTSLDEVTGCPSIARITSPFAGTPGTPSKVTLLVPELMPAFLAGPPGSTFATSAPRATGSPRRRASWGERGERQPLRVDLEQRHVAEDVRADYLRGHAVVVREADVDGLCRLELRRIAEDHVRVRRDVALPVEHEPRAERRAGAA